MDSNFASYDLTRPWVDGGTDAVGKCRIRLDGNSIEVEFALGAKCYHLDNAVGVKTTLSHQVYREIRRIVTLHPVIIISAVDITGILKQAGYGTPYAVERWLKSSFPRHSS
jgi:hypothetical protein